MSTDFHELLAGLREIYQEADWDDDNTDGAMDLGDRLVAIQGIAASLLAKAGWELPKREDLEDETAPGHPETRDGVVVWIND